mgnify:CR=1 FL=1
MPERPIVTDAPPGCRGLLSWKTGSEQMVTLNRPIDGSQKISIGLEVQVARRRQAQPSVGEGGQTVEKLTAL